MKTVLTLYAGVLGQPGLLLRLGGLMMVILVIYQTALTLLLDSLYVPGNQGQTQQAFFENWPRLVLGFVVYGVIIVWLTTIFAIRWHRYVLLGQHTYSAFDVTFAGREWRFVWNSVVVGLIIGLAMVVFFLGVRIVFSFVGAVSPSALAFLNVTAFVLLLLFVNYFIGRFCLVFPATALGVPMRVRDSWYKTREGGKRVMLLLTAMSLPNLIAPELAFLLLQPGAVPEWLATAVGTFLQVFFLLITTALYASTFSYTYRAFGLPLQPPRYPVPEDPI